MGLARIPGRTAPDLGSYALGDTCRAARDGWPALDAEPVRGGGDLFVQRRQGWSRVEFDPINRLSLMRLTTPSLDPARLALSCSGSPTNTPFAGASPSFPSSRSCFPIPISTRAPTVQPQLRERRRMADANPRTPPTKPRPARAGAISPGRRRMPSRQRRPSRRYPAGRQLSCDACRYLDRAQRQVGAETNTQGWLPIPVIEFVAQRTGRARMIRMLRGRDLLHHVQPGARSAAIMCRCAARRRACCAARTT